jgi:hypothetical protein
MFRANDESIEVFDGESRSQDACVLHSLGHKLLAVKRYLGIEGLI